MFLGRRSEKTVVDYLVFILLDIPRQMRTSIDQLSNDVGCLTEELPILTKDRYERSARV